MAAYGIVLNAVDGEEGYYRVSCDWDFIGTVTGISIRKEEFTVGQDVKIVQIGDELGNAEYGFVNIKVPEVPGVLAVPDKADEQMRGISPYNTVCAYIASKIGRIKSIYRRGKVIEVRIDSLLVKNLDAPRSGQEENITVYGVPTNDFSENEVALINDISFIRPGIVGWWEFGGVRLVLIADPEYGGTVDGADLYDVDTEVTATATPTDDDWLFIDWREEGEFVSLEDIYEFVITRDTTLTANFLYNPEITPTFVQVPGSLASGTKDGTSCIPFASVSWTYKSGSTYIPAAARQKLYFFHWAGTSTILYADATKKQTCRIVNFTGGYVYVGGSYMSLGTLLEPWEVTTRVRFLFGAFDYPFTAYSAYKPYPVDADPDIYASEWFDVEPGVTLGVTWDGTPPAPSQTDFGYLWYKCIELTESNVNKRVMSYAEIEVTLDYAA